MGDRAVVLLSGGMDSATALAITKAEGFEVLALTFDYGQRHHKEVEAARRLARHFRVADHRIVSLDLTAIGASALTDRRIRVPEQRSLEEIGRGIPPTYVPARNTILLSYALALAEATLANAIVIAANHLDSSGYPDCRPEYYRAYQEVARLGTKRGVEGDVIAIRTPLIDLTKADIVRKGEELKVPWDLTWSCYLGGRKACGRCDACVLRLKGFREAGVKDPLPYETRTSASSQSP
jgi:7-cyano-7-deazaguanine synthase